MNILTGFDPEKHYLGCLCKQEHSFWDTGKTLRLKSSRNCIECLKGYSKRHYQENKQKRKDAYIENRAEILAKRKEYHAQNKEQRSQYNREHYRKNKDSLRSYNRQYYERNKESIAEKERQRYRDNRSERLEFLRKNYRDNSEQRALIRTRQKQYYQANRESRCAKEKEYSKNNKIAIFARNKKWQKENPEKLREYKKRYVATPKGKLAALRSSYRRRLAMRCVHSNYYSSDEWQNRKAEFSDKCCYCGSTGKLTLDHFIPLSKGGSDNLGNVVPACLSCNCSKQDKDPKEWYDSQAFYDRKRWKKILKVLGKSEATLSQIPLF